MVTHLEPDILECEVKLALGSITMKQASGDDGIPAELLQRCCESAACNMPVIWKQKPTNVKEKVKKPTREKG